MKTGFVRIYGEFRERWWMRPICWMMGHKKEWTSSFGIKYKQCSRCGKNFFSKSKGRLIDEINSKLLSGEEVGELYGVRFMKTKKIKNFVTRL